MTVEEFLSAADKIAHSYGGAYFEDDDHKRLYLEGAFTLEELQQFVTLWKEFTGSSDDK